MNEETIKTKVKNHLALKLKKMYKFNKELLKTNKISVLGETHFNYFERQDYRNKTQVTIRDI